MKNKTPEFQIVQYPDKSSPSGKVFFADKKTKRKFLFIFPYWKWVTVTWSTGESIHWYDFEKCKKDIELLKQGKKIFQ